MSYSRNYVKDPFLNKFRPMNRGDLATGFYNGLFVEQRHYSQRKIGSVAGLSDW
jgi:hypothetical protein